MVLALIRKKYEGFVEITKVGRGGNGVRVWDADAGICAWVSADEGMGDEAR